MELPLLGYPGEIVTTGVFGWPVYYAPVPCGWVFISTEAETFDVFEVGVLERDPDHPESHRWGLAIEGVMVDSPLQAVAVLHDLYKRHQK